MKTPTPCHPNQLIVLYDGVCLLCQRSVQFIIRHDKKNKFVFASLQSDAAQKLLGEIHIKNSLDTIVHLKGQSHFEKSDAVLEIVKNLSGAWPLFFAFKIVPGFLRDAVYTYVAKHRYGWFRKNDSCMVPSAEIRDKFLDY